MNIFVLLTFHVHSPKTRVLNCFLVYHGDLYCLLVIMCLFHSCFIHVTSTLFLCTTCIFIHVVCTLLTKYNSFISWLYLLNLYYVLHEKMFLIDKKGRLFCSENFTVVYFSSALQKIPRICKTSVFRYNTVLKQVLCKYLTTSSSKSCIIM